MDGSACASDYCPGAASTGRIIWCFAITVAAVLLYLCCAWQSRALSCSPLRCFFCRTAPHSEIALEAIPSVLESTTGQSGSCTVCLDEVTALQSAVRLECGHTFHAECIMSWLSHNTTCPNCRALAVP